MKKQNKTRTATFRKESMWQRLCTLTESLKTDLRKINTNNSIGLRKSSFSGKVSKRKFHLLIGNSGCDGWRGKEDSGGVHA